MKSLGDIMSEGNAMSTPPQPTRQAHTPLPWHTGERVEGDYLHPEMRIYWKAPFQNDGSKYLIASVTYPSSADGTEGREELKANADFICKSVNSHESLLKGLQECETMLNSISRDLSERADVGAVSENAKWMAERIHRRIALVEVSAKADGSAGGGR